MWLKLQQSRHQVAIAGQVSDAETGQAIAGAWVALTQVPEPFSKRLALQALQYGDRWETLSQRPDRTHTAMDGYFKFIDLPVGEYKLNVSLPGAGTRYGTAEPMVTVSSEGDRLLPKIIAIALSPTALKGHIQDGQGKPIEMATIQLSGSRETALSDAQGNYSFIGLQASSPIARPHTVTATAQGYNAQFKPITFNQGETQTLNFELERKHVKAAGMTNGS